MSLSDGSGLSATDIMALTGNNFDPSVTARNMLGQNCNTPKEALDLMLRTGRINQSQYNTFLRML